MIFSRILLELNIYTYIYTKCGPLEKGITNSFSILALRTPWKIHTYTQTQNIHLIYSIGTTTTHPFQHIPFSSFAITSFFFLFLYQEFMRTSVPRKHITERLCYSLQQYFPILFTATKNAGFLSYISEMSRASWCFQNKKYVLLVWKLNLESGLFNW